MESRELTSLLRSKRPVSTSKPHKSIEHALVADLSALAIASIVQTCVESVMRNGQSFNNAVAPVRSNAA